MRCEFEEKQFEQHLNMQLIQKPHLLYPPGQVLENSLGFDAALFTTNKDFWSLFQTMPSGIQLDPSWWKRLKHQIDLFPPFRFNVFIQHKRPAYITTAKARQWNLWSSPYYRYRLRTHQQAALENLEAKLHEEALVVYASPAFHTTKKLWETVSDQNLVEHTNFAQAAQLRGHRTFTYIQPGKEGIACSEPQRIESVDFQEHLARLANTAPQASNQAFIIHLGNILERIIQESLPPSLRQRHGSTLRYLRNQGLPEEEFATALGTIASYRNMTGAVWFVGIQPPGRPPQSPDKPTAEQLDAQFHQTYIFETDPEKRTQQLEQIYQRMQDASRATAATEAALQSQYLGERVWGVARTQRALVDDTDEIKLEKMVEFLAENLTYAAPFLVEKSAHCLESVAKHGLDLTLDSGHEELLLTEIE